MKTGVHKIFAVLLICSGLYVYRNALHVPFIFDDLPAIAQNPSIRQLWPLRDVLVPPPIRPIVTRPIVNLSLAINYALGRLNVWGYHVFNLTVHLLAALVLYGVLRRTLLRPCLSERYGEEARWLAFAITLIWVVHPLQTESVTYTLQRTELLMGLFFLLALYCAIRSAASPHAGRWHAAAVVATGLGIGSKEVMLMAPPLMLGYDRVFLSASWREVFRRRWKLYAGMVVMGLCFAPILYRGVASDIARVSSSQVTRWAYAKTQASVIIHYLRLAVWPHPLVGDYYDWPLSGSVASILPTAAVVFILLGATVWSVYRRLPVGFLGLWFFLILAPTSSFWPLLTEFAAERRMYLPLAAVIALMVIGAHTVLKQIFQRFGWKATLPRLIEITALVLIGATLAEVSVRRNEDYRSVVSFWSDVVAKRPNNARGHNNLGVALAELRLSQEALAHYREALRLDPNYAAPHNNLALILASQGKPEEAIVHYREALRLDPNYSEAANNLGVALANLGRSAEAVTYYREALQLDPEHVEAHNNLGAALASQGKPEEAIAHYQEALRFNPKFVEAHNNLGVALAGQGRLAEAIAHYREALRLDPKYVVAYTNLGDALGSQGNLDQAAGEYLETLRIDPNSVRAERNLGVLFARQGKMKESVAHFSAALQIAPSPQAHYNLGIALFRDGNTQEAIRHLETALALDPGYEQARQTLEVLNAAKKNERK